MCTEEGPRRVAERTTPKGGQLQYTGALRLPPPQAMRRRLAIDDCKPEYSALYPPHILELMKCAIIQPHTARRPKAVGIMRGRQPVLLLLCVAALTGSVAGKKCRDEKSVKNCGKKRTKNFFKTWRQRVQSQRTAR